jgi:hypothetical protein
MDIFAFGILYLAYIPGFVTLPHFKRCGHVTVIFGVGVNFSAFFDRFDKLDRLRHSFAWQNFAHDMPAGFQQTDSKRRMFVCVIHENNRVHIVIEKIIEIFV